MRVAIWHPHYSPEVPGGHHVQLVKLASELEKLGHEVLLSVDGEPNLDGVDVVHGMGTTAAQIRLCHRRALPVVLSTVYAPSRWRVDSTFLRTSASKTRAGLGAFRAAWQGNLFPKALRSTPRLGQAFLAVHLVDRILPNAQGEYQALVEELEVSTPATIVPNAADPVIFDAGPEVGSRDAVVVCAGRIEPHKNQLALISAARDLGVKLLIVGDSHPHHNAYYRRCRDLAQGADVEFVGRQPPEALAEIFARAAVHALPSWFETTGLVSLEAGLAGAKIVSTDRGFANEYLEQDAWYCNPASARSLRSAIARALDAPWRPRLRSRILERFTWAEAAEATVRGYEAVLG